MHDFMHGGDWSAWPQLRQIRTGTVERRRWREVGQLARHDQGQSGPGQLGAEGPTEGQQPGGGTWEVGWPALPLMGVELAGGSGPTLDQDRRVRSGAGQQKRGAVGDWLAGSTPSISWFADCSRCQSDWSLWLL